MSEETPSAQEAGRGPSPRRLGASLLGLLQGHVELFGIELQEQKTHSLYLLLLGGLTLIFAIMLSWLPAGGWGDGSLRFLILPMIALALPQLAVFARLTRGSMIEALRTDHIRTARAYGLPARSVVVVHAMRGAMLPIVSYLAPCAAALLTGSAVVETIFTIPGVGRYFVLGAINRDYTLVMGTVVLIAIFVIVFNLAVDILYGLLDPRVRHD